MTGLQMRDAILERLGEQPGAQFYTAAEALELASRAQRLLVMLTLCLETTAPLPLSAGVSWYQPLTTFADWFVPLRVRRADGSKVHPAILDDLHAISRTWQGVPGSPERYASAGGNLLAIYPRPAGGGESLQITYARCPADVQASGAVPETPEEYHTALVDCGVFLGRLKEGGSEMQSSYPLFERFLGAAGELGAAVRMRARQYGYDRAPVEISRADISKLIGAEKKGRR